MLIMVVTLFALSGPQKIVSNSTFSWYARFQIVNWAMLSEHDFSKIDHLLTFPPIESDLSVVRPLRLFWEIDMILRKLANTNVMSWEATENFLEGSEVAVATFCTIQTLLLPLVTSKREFHKVATATSEPSKKFSVASHDMKFVFASFLMIISITKSKRMY